MTDFDDMVDKLFNDPGIKARQAAALEWIEHLIPVAVQGAVDVKNAGGDQKAAMPTMDIIVDHMHGLDFDQLTDLVATLMPIVGSSVFSMRQILELHHPTEEDGFARDCSDGTCEHSARDMDCPVIKVQVCAECLLPEDSFVAWPCATAKLLQPQQP